MPDDGQDQGQQPGGDADPVRTKPLVLGTQLGGAVFLVLTFWVVVVLLPEAPLATGSVLVKVLVGAVLLAVLLAAGYCFRLGKGSPVEDFSPFGAATLAAYVLLLDVLLALALSGAVRFTTSVKFALAVGGGAVASFVFGVIVFSTIRVAASLPIVVLFIGVVAFPDSVPAQIRDQLITWMGVILGVSAGAEGATQAAKVIGSAQVSKAVAATSGGDPVAAERLTRSLTRSPQAVGGDLQTTANGNPTYDDP